MTRLTDGKKTVEITIHEWTGKGWTPDWSNDFFVVATLPYDAEKEAYIVDDVDWCIDQAMDWEQAAGDFYYDTDSENRKVEISIKTVR